jgi:hypothetical protein
MICIPVIRIWRDHIWPACKLLFIEFVKKPFRGLVEIAKGLYLAVPELANALREAVDSHLSFEARAKVQEGLERIAKGWMLLRWPLTICVMIIGLGWYGVALIITMGPFLAT